MTSDRGPVQPRITADSGEAGEIVRVSPRMLELLERAGDVAQLRVGERVVGTEHLLRALLDDPDALATQMIARYTTIASLRDALDQVMATEGYRLPTTRIHPTT